MAATTSDSGLTKAERPGFRTPNLKIDTGTARPKRRRMIRVAPSRRFGAPWRAPTGLRALGARLALLAVLIALLAQTLAFGMHGARAAQDARSAAAALEKIVGAPVWICVNDDGAPQAPVDCHGVCPLCRLADQAATLDLPEAPPTLAPPLPLFLPQPPPRAPPAPALAPQTIALARGPPVSL